MICNLDSDDILGSIRTEEYITVSILVDVYGNGITMSGVGAWDISEVSDYFRLG